MLNQNLNPIKKGLLPMNLQLFAEEQMPMDMNSPEFRQQVMNILEGQGTELPPAENIMQAQAEAPPQTPPVEGQPWQQNPEANPQPESGQGTELPPQTQPTQEQLIAGKFKSVDDLAKSYSNLEAFNTKTRQELSQLAQQNAELMSKLQQLEQQSQQVVPQGNENNPNNAQMVDSETFMNEFYENPTQALQKILQPILQQQLQPIEQKVNPLAEKEALAQKKLAWQNNVDQFLEATPDAAQFVNHMAEFFKQNPDLMEHPNGMNLAYQSARGMNYVDPKSLLNDASFVEQNIMNNPQIKDKIIQEHLKSVQKGNNAPQVIGNQPGAGMQMSPENTPKTMEEARMAALKLFGINEQ